MILLTFGRDKIMVSQQEKDEMSKILSLMEGKPITPTNGKPVSSYQVELAGPGQVTQADVHAMSKVLESLNKISTNAVSEIISESKITPELSEALMTERLDTSVKIGRYEIMILEDQKRIAGKQYYRIVNTNSNDVIADDISLYETARTVVKYLHSGKFVNDPEVRKLFELDTAYSSHKVDAIRYKRLLNKNTTDFKKDLYESRYQASVDRCMQAKHSIKKIAS